MMVIMRTCFNVFLEAGFTGVRGTAGGLPGSPARMEANPVPWMLEMREK